MNPFDQLLRLAEAQNKPKVPKPWSRGKLGNKGNTEPKLPRVPAPVGERFGWLVVLGEGARHANPQASGYYARRWRCKCDCGVERDVSMANLRSGNTKSCGCGSGISTRFKQYVL